MAPVSRKGDIDLIKTVAVCCIVCIHACSAGYGAEVGSFDWLSTLFWGSVTRAGVPLFLMCSGALMLDPFRELSLKKLYGKNILRLLAALFFWAALYGVYDLAAAGNLNGPALRHLAKELLLFRHKTHLYYMHIILLVYACLPVTRLFIKTATRRQVLYFLALWLALGILHPTLRPWWPFSLLSGIPVQWGMNLTWCAVGYGVLGWYLQTADFKRRWPWLPAAVIGAAAVFCGTWYFSRKAGALYEGFLGGNHLAVCLLAVGIYALCRGAQPGKWAAFVSKGSFCVYLSHMFFLYLFKKLSFTAISLPPLAGVPLLTAAVLGCSLLLYLILSRIPFVNRWLI